MATETDQMEGAVKTVLELAQKGLLEPKVLDLKAPDPDGPGMEAPVLLLPSMNGQLQSVSAVSIKKFLDEYRDAPERREGQCVVEDIDSFVNHVNRFKDEDSALFGCSGLDGKEGKLPRPVLLCVLDYHEAGSKSAPRFGKHRSRYNFPLSEQWKVWTEHDGQIMDQRTFAEFMNDHLLDIASPEMAGETAKLVADALEITYATHVRLLELSRGLTIAVNQKVTEQRNLQTGEVVLNFTEEHADATGQPLKIPGGFLLGIPVFRNGDAYQIAVQLRYRKSGGSINWFYELYEPERVFEHAFRGACEIAQKGTSLPLFFGSPE
jgi:uncharacterized protein YfdQ (DUF2303 family)